MAANTGATDSTGRKNIYNVSYGMLSTGAKTAPDGYESIELSDIKSRRLKKENVDLRSRFYDTKNGKDYPLRVFYTDIDGIIESVEKDKYSKGTSLKVTLHDADGDESIITTDFYGKISADLLNRLVNAPVEKELNFRPYSIPSDFKDDKGVTINFYNAGVSIKNEGVKVERAFKRDNGLPSSEQIEDANGEMQTSRVKQVNFLWSKIEGKFSSAPQASADAPVNSPAQAAQPVVDATAPKKTALPF